MTGRVELALISFMRLLSFLGKGFGNVCRSLRYRTWAGLLLVLPLWVNADGGRLPNIVLILADDMGWNDVGYHGSEIRTPRIDELAAGGIALDQFHSQPTCTPTRAALMTGKSPQRLGIYRQFAKYATEGLPATELTIADHLGRAGYQTWLVGKWHLGHARREFHPNSRGFDHFYGHVTGGIGYWDHVHGGGLDWQRNGESVREKGYSTHLLRDEARRLIVDRDRDRPFFLYASFNAPHLPNEAPPETVSSYAELEPESRRRHAAMVTELDSAIGSLVDLLSDEGELQNTLIWFLSDNGGLNPESMADSPWLSVAQRVDAWFDGPAPITFLEFIRTNVLDGGADNGPLRLGKGSVYEGGVRVPSLVHWDGMIEPGIVADMLTVQDVLPTLLEAAGLDMPADLDGASQWPVVTGTGASRTPDYLTIGQSGEQAYYAWPWKLVALADQPELYNLETDSYEASNVAAMHPEKVASLQEQLARFPRAENLHIPLYKVMLDPDFFGGAEDRPPWTDLITE